jgi:23S rRNA pseudouridine1911/1915/1917 synthase
MTRGGSTISATIASDAAGWRLDRALAAAVPTLSRERLKVLISSGAVTGPAGAAVRDPASKAAPGRYEVLVPEPAPAHNEAQDIALDIAFEDDHLLSRRQARPGMVVHPAAGNADGTLVNALLHHCAGRLSGIGGVARPGIVHRIDKDTSGLLVVAKTDRAHEGLAAAVRAARPSTGSTRRSSRSSEERGGGTVDAPLARSSANRQKMAIVEEGRGKRAVTHWRLVKPLRESALVECRLETGRTHQVRVHMASLGHPLVGDPVYGRTRPAHRDLLKSLGLSAPGAARRGARLRASRIERKLVLQKPPSIDIQELFGALPYRDETGSTRAPNPRASGS